MKPPDTTPSGTTPSSTLLLAEVAAEVPPPGVLYVITGDRTTGGLMIDHKAPQMVSITGSVPVGMEVAVEGIETAGLFNAGQDCTAATRVLVRKNVHGEFVAALAAWAKDNAPDRYGIRFGPVNNVNQLERVSGILAALPSNAKVELGGSRQGNSGYFCEATIVPGLKQTVDAIQIEIFGPVITVQSFTDEAQALTWANGGAVVVSWETHDRGAPHEFHRLSGFGVRWRDLGLSRDCRP